MMPIPTPQIVSKLQGGCFGCFDRMRAAWKASNGRKHLPIFWQVSEETGELDGVLVPCLFCDDRCGIFDDVVSEFARVEGIACAERKI